MKLLAVRCSNTDFVYALIEGTKQSPNVIECTAINYPKGYEEHSLFHWFHQEIMGLLNNHCPDAVAVKTAESMVKRSNTLETRIRVEGIALMSAAEAGCTSAHRKVKATISKDLGMKGQAKCLETELDTSPIPDFDSYNSKKKEAVLIGWSCLE